MRRLLNEWDFRAQKKSSLTTVQSASFLADVVIRRAEMIATVAAKGTPKLKRGQCIRAAETGCRFTSAAPRETRSLEEAT